MKKNQPTPLLGTTKNITKPKDDMYWCNQDPKYADIRGKIITASNFSLLNDDNPINQIVKIIGEYQNGASVDICLFSKAKL